MTDAGRHWDLIGARVGQSPPRSVAAPDPLPSGVDFDQLPPHQRAEYDEALDRRATAPSRRPTPAATRPAADEWPRDCAHAPARGRILSGFGPRASRINPDETRQHNGLDIPGPRGSDVYAIGDGIVEHVTGNGERGFARYGRTVVIRHPQWRVDGTPVRSLYAHLEKTEVSEGTRIRAGERIAGMGDTRGSVDDPGARFSGSGVHLHFEVAAGRYPRAHDAPRIEPVGFLGARGVTYDGGGRLGRASGCEGTTPPGPRNSSPGRPSPFLALGLGVTVLAALAAFGRR